MDTLTTPGGESAATTAEQPVAELDNVDMQFKRKGDEPFRAVSELSFRIEPGTVFCLLGPNGSGKTTTLNLLSGLLTPTSGQVRVLGLNPAKQRTQLLRQISLAPQETALYNELTARENLEFHSAYYGIARNTARERVATTLDLVSLTDRADDRVGTYSGGMQRRLALARALLTEPRLLFLDEPTLGVDVQSRQAIWERVRQIADEGRTVLLTTNYMEEAERLGDQVCIIDQGRRVALGSTADLKAQAQRRQLELNFNDPAAAEAAQPALAGDFESTLTGPQLLVSVPADADHVPFLRSVLDRLDGQDGLSAFRFSEPSLQDVFLHFTGRDLRD